MLTGDTYHFVSDVDGIIARGERLPTATKSAL
jgi:hypothetical protein